MLDAVTGEVRWRVTSVPRGIDLDGIKDTPLLRISPDGRRVVVAGGKPPQRAGSRCSISLVTYTADTGKAESRPSADLGPGTETAALSAGGNLLGISSHGSKSLQVWDTRTGKRVGPSCQHPNTIVFVTFSPDGRLASTYCMDWQVRTWEVATGKLAGPPFVTQAMSRFTPDGRYLVVHQYSPVPTISLWDWKTGQPVLPERRTGLTGMGIWAGLTLTISPDGRRAACGPRSEVRLFGLDDLHDPPPDLSLDDLTNFVELQSFRRVHEAGTLEQFTGDEWNRRWEQFLTTHPDGLPVYDRRGRGVGDGPDGR
jgi:WD40 repeat protein